MTREHPETQRGSGVGFLLAPLVWLLAHAAQEERGPDESTQTGDNN